MTKQKMKRLKEVAEILSMKGYEFDMDKDGLWIEEYDFQDAKTKEVFEEMLNFSDLKIYSLLKKMFDDADIEQDVFQKYSDAFIPCFMDIFKAVEEKKKLLPNFLNLDKWIKMYKEGKYLETNLKLLSEQCNCNEGELMNYLYQKAIKFTLKYTKFKNDRGTVIFVKDQTMIVLDKNIKL